MAAPGYTPLSLYYSITPTIVPLAGNLVNGELAINIADGKLYFKNSTGVVTLLNTVGGLQGYITATAGQTICTIPFTYQIGANRLYVFVNGSKQVIGLNYTETTSTSITFITGLNVGDIVEFV